MISKNPGFDSKRLLSITLYDQTLKDLYSNLSLITHEINSIEDVENNTFSCSSPAIINTSAGEADWEGKHEGQHVNVQWNAVYFNYFETIGVPVIAGRDFSDINDNDITQDNKSSFILNETAVKAMGYAYEEAINRKFTLYDKTGPIIGIVKDFHFKPLYERIQPMAFFIHPYYLREFLIKGKSEITPELIAKVKKIWNKYLPDDPFDYAFVNHTYQDIYNAETKLLNYNSFMALLIVIISSLGFSGLAFLIIDNKTKEIGIRKIHGASSLSITNHLLGMFLKWILVASSIAIPLGLYISIKWLERFAFKTDIALDIFILPVVFISCIAFFSIAYRVFQSSIRNPADVLRYE
jgi:putative ABC transport system permease protein